MPQETNEPLQDDILQLFNCSPLPMGICVIEGDDIRHITDNPAAAKFFCSSQNEMKGAMASALGAPKDAIQNWIKHYKMAEKTQTAVSFEYDHIVENKKLFLSATVTYLGKTKKGDSKFSYFVQNISEIKESEASLKSTILEKEEMYKVVVESMSDAMVLFDADKNLIFQNPASLTLHGFKDESGLIGNSSLPETWTAFDETGREIDFDEWPLARVFRHERFKDHVINVRRLETGHEFQGSYSGCPIYDSNGKIKYAFITIRDVSAAKKAEKALKESEERLRLALEAAKMGVYERDLTTGNVIWSEQAKSMLGFHNIEPSFEKFLEHMEEEDRIRFHKEAMEAVRNGRSVDVDYKFKRPDGNRRWIHAFGKVITDRSGKAIRTIGVLQDVTERKLIESTLKEREQDLAIEKNKFHSLLLQAPAIFSLTRGPDHVFEIFNIEARKGIGGRDCTGLPIRKALPELEGKGFFEALDNVYLTGEPLHLTEASADLIQPDGSEQTHYFNVVYHPWRDQKGNIAGIMNVSVDVTEQVQARKRVELAELELRTLANSMPQLAFMGKADGSIYWYNDNWYNFTGMTTSEIEGWGWQKVHDPEILPHVVEKWTKSIKTGEPFEMEFPLRGADGTFCWFLTRAAPLKDSSGKVIRWFGTNTDIEKQRKVREDLKDTVKARDEFLSIASHELKTPLTSVLLQTQIVERMVREHGLESLGPVRFEKFLNLVNTQSLRLSRLVEDMLDIARIRSGKLTIRKEYIELNEVVNEAIDRLKSALFEAGTTPEYECEGEIYGYFDKMRIEQVVINLLTNAMKYGARKPISIFLKKIADKVEISVRDQGIGVVKEAQSRIFDRFERDISANEVSGLGLGLFITKEIVEAHGGNIRVESKGQDRGSTFIVVLPLGHS